MIDDDGNKYIEAIAILNKHINNGSVDTIEGLGVMAKLLRRYNAYLKVWNEGRLASLDDKYLN
jgi:hypothetical protein